MKAVIMAAGRGTRISRYIQNQPKCCIDVNGTPLIKRTIQTLLKKGISEIAVVTGYQNEYIVEQLRGVRYQRFYNPFFDITNSIVSLWFAGKFISAPDDLVILNGDVFFEEKVLDWLLSSTKTPVMLADSTRISEADYRFQWVNNRLAKFGKELTDAETTGEYVGIAKINRDFLGKFIIRMEELINTQKHYHWWEDVLYSFVAEGEAIYINDIAGLFWAEVDFIEDYIRIINYTKTFDPERGSERTHA